MKISEMKLDKTKDKKGDLLLVTLVLDQQAKDRNGKEVFPGLKITDRVSLQTTPKYDDDMILKRLKAIQLACFTEADCPKSFMPLDQYLNRSVTIKLRVETDETGQYDDSNRVAKWVPKG